MISERQTTRKYPVKEVDMALNYLKVDQENSIPQDSFRDETMDQLQKFGLVEKLQNGTYAITDRGIYARQLGAFKYIEMKKSEDFFSDYSPERYENQKKLIQTSFYIALVLLLILFITLREDFIN